jgi:hypothetical protein
MSQGRKCVRAGLVLIFPAGDVQGQKCFAARSVLQPEVSKSLGLEVSRGRTWFAAGSVLELIGKPLLKKVEKY